MQSKQMLIENPIQKSLGAVNVGTSVMAVKYRDGVMVAADTSITYGSMCKVKDARRIVKLNDECVMACSGEMADAQDLEKQLRQKVEEDEIAQDGATFMRPLDYFNFVARQNYQRRLKMNPLWCSTVVGGVDKETGEPFLGVSDLYGTKLQEDFVLTGLGNYFCQVIMQNRRRDDMSEQEARELILDCMKVMFYRDKKAHDKVQISTITKAGVTMHEPIDCPTQLNQNFYVTQTNELFRPMRVMQ